MSDDKPYLFKKGQKAWNTGIGLLQDSEIVLISAAGYIRKHNG